MASCATHLKSKAYFIFSLADKHNYFLQGKMPEITKYLQDVGVEISTETDFSKLLKEFAKLDYHDYASIIIYLHRNNAVELIYSSFRRNSTLKYVTKLLIADNSLDTIDHSNGIGRRHHSINRRDHSIKRRDLYNSISKYIDRIGRSLGYTSRHDRIARHSYTDIAYEKIKLLLKLYICTIQDKLVKNPFIDNLIVITYAQVKGKLDILTFVLDVQRIVEYSKKSSIQEGAESIIKQGLEFKDNFECFITTTSTENYLFNINPAIAIMINHQTFFNQTFELDFRSESQKDIEALQRSFRSKKITCYTLNDGSLEDVQAIMQNVRTIDFKGLKNMYLVIMSHGDDGDIIYTKTESYSLRDEIVQPLLENPTLANAQKFIIVNACRGEYDPRYDDDSKLLEEIQTKLNDSIIYPQDEKLMMIFSTQKGCISLRFNEVGSIFVQEFCNSFAMDFYEKPMESICQETKQLMEFHIYDDQIPEFQINDDRPHNIRMEFDNFFSNRELIQDMTDFFKKQFQNNSIDCGFDAARNVFGCGYVDGSLNDMQKMKMEHRLTSEYSERVDENCLDSVLKFQWSNEERTGCNRVLATIENND